jgi:SPP1 gp7 family putative phage head morphogenesis protein
MAMAAILDDPLFWAEQKRLMIERMQPIFLELFLTGSAMGANQKPVAEKAAMPWDFDAVNTAAAEIIGRYSDQWWEYVNETDRNLLREALLTAEREGYGVEWVMQEIEPLFGEVRAQRIAVSETTNLMGMGAQETYRQAGFQQWEWRTVRDSDVDPICRALDKQRFPNSREFQRAHVGCRCWPVPYGEATATAAMSQQISALLP